ncbi:MAG: di-trans,poly-cis-decaprenylcistransferase [Fimbriimonadaceae bacterium]|nr:di-trans,poly-cis-decaprenylcistransferase [Fimbriimonadaceae bacterium]
MPPLPTHIAIIMDGNGRWARSRGIGRLLGHREGYATLKNVVNACGEIGIPYLTVYAFSAENWRRPEDEVKGLMQLIERAMLEQIDNLRKNNVQVRIIGRMDELRDSLRRALQKGIDETKHCTGLVFTLAINYGGRAEIVDAIQDLIKEGTPPDEITEELISSRMYDPSVPEPDLMIRTAGEMRWSNFLIWQAAYCELYVTECSWPEFDKKQLVKAIESYQNRTRKFGAVVE